MNDFLSRSLSPLALALVFWFPGPRPARAALDPEVNQPYRLRVVLDVAKNRQLTGIFIDRLQRDLRDMLQADLGDLARVEIVRSHKQLPEIRARGLKKALDGISPVENGKTHFVLIRYSGGRFEIEARQRDGLTGMPSPLVRKSQTTEPQLVARQAALLVRQDFGLVGTVTGVNNQTAELTLKGAGLGVDLGKWVQVNDVFALAQISGAGQGRQSAPMQWAFLQVMGEPKNGVCVCRFYHRFQGDTLAEQGQVAGYRALKLATVRAPLRLRFLDFRTHAPLETALQVKIGTAGFDGADETISSGIDSGMAQTQKAYNHLAFVQVVTGGKQVARLPIPILSDHTVDCLISINPQAEAQGEKELRRERWLRRVYDSLRVASDRITQLNKLGKKSLADAKQVAHQGLKNMDADLLSLTEEGARLQKEEGLDLSEGEQRLEELGRRRDELKRYVQRLDQIAQEERDPRRQEMQQLLAQARLQETQAEFGKAIEIYEKILKEHPKETNVRARLKKVEEAFAVQNKEHGDARKFIYETYPKLQTPSALERGLKEVRRAFQVCAKNNDRLSPQRILRAIIEHTAALKKRRESLRPETSEDDRKEAEIIGRVAREMAGLNREIEDYLKKNRPAVP